MPDQLIQPLLGHSSVALVVNVSSVSSTSRPAIDEDMKWHGSSLRWQSMTSEDRERENGMRSAVDLI